MSIECWYCERDLRGPHADDCPKRVMHEQKQNIERLTAALDKACEAIETQPRVGASSDYANGFYTGMQCQRLHAKHQRDAAIKGEG